jgi:hypothetical protein
MGNYFDDVTLTLTVPTGTGTATDVSCDVTAATLTPDTPEEIRKRLCGQKTVTGATTWTLDLEYDQNWAEASAGPPVVSQGLSLFLSENAGQLADFKIEWPLEDTQATGQVRLKPGPYGGTAGEIAEATVTLGLDGEPTFAPIAATLAAGGDDDHADEDGTVAYEKAAA